MSINSVNMWKNKMLLNIFMYPWFVLQKAKFQSLKEAFSFVSLVDGYFRLTTDSSHYFCQDIAPPSILEGIKNHCHGPITWVILINSESNSSIYICVLNVVFISCLIRSEIAVNKLKKSGFKGGTFLVRQSPKDYDNFFLTVCVQVKLPFDATWQALKKAVWGFTSKSNLLVLAVHVLCASSTWWQKKIYICHSFGMWSVNYRPLSMGLALCRWCTCVF